MPTVRENGFEGELYNGDGTKDKVMIVGPSGTSCWSYKGKEIPYAPYNQRTFDILKMFMEEKELRMNFFQCIVYYLLPAFVLGIVPMVCFLLDKEKKSTVCWFFYGFAMIGLIQTSPDWFGLYPILRQVPRDAFIQISGWHT